MPYPPPVLPIAYTNAQPQQDAHPQAHNNVNLAVNDLNAHAQVVDDQLVTAYTALVDLTNRLVIAEGKIAALEAQMLNVVSNLTYLLSLGRFYTVVQAVQLDGDGVAILYYPAGIFGVGVPNTWAENCETYGGVPTEWCDVKVYALTQTSFNIQVAKQGTDAPFADGQVILTYVSFGFNP